MNLKCSVFIATSLDGYIARPDGGIDWLSGPGDEDSYAEDHGFQAFFDSIDSLVMGRVTFEQVLTFGEWPYGEKKVVVLSHASPNIPEHLSEVVEIMSGEPGEIVQRLAESGYRHAYVDGGVTIQGFLRAGLIDELIITTLPVLIGQGLPLFGGLEQDIHLEHIETRAFKSGLVQSRYQVVK